MNRDFIKIIDVAKSGNGKAYEDLYNMTKDSAYFVAFSITKNEQDAMDILQDSYLKAFNSLDTLRQPEVFDSWLNRIVANNSKKYISKNKPLLFGDISNDIPNLYEEESKSGDNTPHEIIDNKETSKMVMDIIDNLSEDKRLIVIMYYYQEMLVKEISETLDLPITTVKYKLLSARQDMKKDILSLEKKGMKIYSVAPLAIVSSALAAYVSSIEVPVFASVLPTLAGGVAGALVIGSGGAVTTSTVAGATVTSVAEGTALAGATVTGAAVTGAAVTGVAASTAGAVTTTTVAGGVGGFLSTIGGKVVATSLAVAVIGGGTTVAVVNNNSKDNNPTEIVTTVISDLEQDISEENILENTTSEPITKIEEETSENKEEIPAVEVVNMTTEGYSSMESIKIWSDFKVKESEELVDGLTRTNVSITGSYPLSKSDIADSIVIESAYRYYSYIEINGVKKKFRGAIIFDAEIIDIDSEDEYKEVVVYDHGPSADPAIHIFRFVDNSIVEIGSFGAKYEYDEILFNGKGRIIGGTNYLYFLDTEIVTEFTEVKDDVVNIYHPDYNELLNKKYILSKDIEVEYPEEPNLTDTPFENNRVRLEEGMEIKLLEIKFVEDYFILGYVVELPDGSIKEMRIPYGD